MSPRVRLVEGGGVYVVETRADAGTELQSHRHRHDHVSVLVEGRALLTIGGQTREIEGYYSVVIPAGTDHRVEALSDVVWLCVWSADIAPRSEVKEFLEKMGPGCAGCPGNCIPTEGE